MSGVGRLKYLLKVAVAHLLYVAGLLQLWQRIVLRRKAVVLMYHRVLTPDERRQSGSHPALVVDRDSFASQMALLKRRFTVLSVQEFADCLERKKPFPNSSCLITFDDGWRDNFTNALPILAQYELPALVFLPMSYVGQRRVFWQEGLTHVLTRVILHVRAHPDRRQRFESLLEGTGLEGLLGVDDADPRAHVIDAIGTQKRLTRFEIEGFLATLAAELGLDVADFADTDGFIDWGQVEMMAAQNIAFGGHGVDHLLLTQVSEEEVDREIRDSRAVIEQNLSEPVLTFSYPNGYFTDEIVKKVKTSGYQLAFSTRRGFVAAGDDPFAVARRNIHEGAAGTAPMFLARLVGLW